MRRLSGCYGLIRRMVASGLVVSVLLGRSCWATAAVFGVSVAVSGEVGATFSAGRGSAAPNPAGGPGPLRLAGHREWLLQRLGQKGMTLRRLVAESAVRRVCTSYGALWPCTAKA